METLAGQPQAAALTAEDRLFIASQRQLTGAASASTGLGVFSLFVLLALYFAVFTYEFWAPYGAITQHKGFVNTPPTRIRLVDSEGAFRGPFVYGLKFELDLDTFERVYTENTDEIHPIRFFPRGERYRFWGRINGSLHLFDAGEGKVFLLGSDNLGRDLFSRDSGRWPHQPLHRPRRGAADLHYRGVAGRHLRLLRRLRRHRDHAHHRDLECHPEDPPVDRARRHRAA